MKKNNYTISFVALTIAQFLSPVSLLAQTSSFTYTCIVPTGNSRMRTTPVRSANSTSECISFAESVLKNSSGGRDAGSWQIDQVESSGRARTVSSGLISAIASTSTNRPSPGQSSAVSGNSAASTSTSLTNTSESSTSSGSSIGSIAGATGGACVANLASQAAISLLIGSLTIQENFTNVPVVTNSGSVGNAYRTGSSFVNDLKTLCLDPAARAIYTKILAQTQQSVFNWANNGFKGGPTDGMTFVTNLDSYLGDIQDTTTQTWLADQDSNSLFTTEITNAIYREARRDQSSGYTPDLAERILLEECNTYQQNLRNNAGAARENQGSNIFGSVSNFFQGLFDTNSYRSNYPGIQNGTLQNGQGIIPRSGFNSLFVTKAFAQSFSAQPNLPAANNNRNLILGGSFAGVGNGTSQANENPCNRRLTTASERQSIIDAYRAGSANLSSNSRWEILLASTKCNNRLDCAVMTAVNSKNSSVSNAQENERTQLQFNNGNTGTRVCVSWLPQTADERAANVERVCRQDGYRTTTPGALVGSQVSDALAKPLDTLNTKIGSGTFEDLAKAAITGLITGLTNQLVNSVDGFLSFNSKSGQNSAGKTNGGFTQSVLNVNQPGYNSTLGAADIGQSIYRLETFIGVLSESRNTSKSITDTVAEVQSVCKNILDRRQTALSGFLREQQADQNHRCNIDVYNLDYKNDPTAGARLAQNPIYIEVQKLDGTKTNTEQFSVSLTNARSTLSALQSSQRAYQSSTDTNRDITLIQNIATYGSSIPQDVDITSAQNNLTDLRKRLVTMEQVLTELKTELATLQTN